MTPFVNSVRCANTKFKQGLPSLVNYSFIFMRGGVSGVSQKFPFDSCCLRLTPKIKYALIIISTTANHSVISIHRFISNISWLCFDFHQIKETFGKKKKRVKCFSFFRRTFLIFSWFWIYKRRLVNRPKSLDGVVALAGIEHIILTLFCLRAKSSSCVVAFEEEEKNRNDGKMADVSAHTLVDVYCITSVCA